jgi:DNA-binding NarL/FixJ family response regulator
MLRVLLVDDYEPWRAFAASMLQNQTELRIVGEATDGSEAVQIAQQIRPDLILLDIGLPKLNGLEAARRIRELCPRSKIVVVSENCSRDFAEAALRTGAGGYVVKSSAASELLPAIAAVLEGKQFISPRLAGRTLGDEEHGHTGSPPLLNVEHHEIRFYANDAALVDDFASFLEPSAQKGHTVIVIATESHCTDIRRRLQARGLDTSIAVQQKRYIGLDVADAHLPFIEQAIKAATGEGLHIAVG